MSTEHGWHEVKPLGRRLIFWLLVVAVIPLVTISYQGYSRSVEILAKQSKAQLMLAAELKMAAVSEQFKQYEQDLEYLSQDQLVSGSIAALGEALSQYEGSAERFVMRYEWALIVEKVTTGLKQFQQNFLYPDLWLIDLQGNLLYSAMDDPQLGSNLLENTAQHGGPLATAISQTLESGEAIFTDFFHDQQQQVQGYLLRLVTTDEGDKVGVIALKLPYRRLAALLQDSSHMGESGETYLLGSDLVMRTASRELGDTVVLQQKVEGAAAAEWQNLLRKQGKEGHDLHAMTYLNYRGSEVIGTPALLRFADKPLLIISEMNTVEVFAPAHRLKQRTWMVGVATVVVVILIAWWITGTLTRPLKRIMAAISGSTAEIATTIHQQTTSMHSQLGAFNEVNTTVEELDRGAQNSYEQIEKVNGDTAKRSEMVNHGSDKVNLAVEELKQVSQEVVEVMEQIEGLDGQIAEIDEITEVVLDLANQTRLLAMNAAVEAVHGGEQGKGFNVVAREVRKLSDESKASAKDISSMLHRIQRVMSTTVTMANSGVESINKGTRDTTEITETLDQVVHSYNETTETIAQVMVSIREQSVAISQIATTMGKVRQGQVEMMTGIDQIRGSIESLEEVVKQVERMV